MTLTQDRPAARPASAGQRALAGMVDLFVLLVLGLVYFAVPMLLRGVVVPMWGVLAAIVGYSVVPLAFFKKTLGMRLFGLELVTKDGHAVDLANLLFREMLGRGLFPLSFLYTLAAGLVASVLGIAGFFMPTGIGAIMATASLGAVAAAMLGQVLSFNRPDGRTLADLLARSFVVVGPARPPPDDEDERQAEAEALSRRRRNVIIFEVVLMVAAVGLPWVLAMRTGETSGQRGDRIMRKSIEKKFAAAPANEQLARDLERAYAREGLVDEAQQVGERHRQALAKRATQREGDLKRAFDEKPHDRPTAQALIELYEDSSRLDEAKAVYRRYLGAPAKPSEQLGFANWLASSGFTDEAIVEARAALAVEPLLPLGHTILGVSLERMGDFEAARDELVLATLDDAEDEDAQDHLEKLESTLGPTPPAKKKALVRQFAAWRADAGLR